MTIRIKKGVVFTSTPQLQCEQALNTVFFSLNEWYFVSVIKIMGFKMSWIKSARRWFDRRVTDRNLLGQILRKMRRFYLGTFNPGYIQKSIAENREGECHRCGLCCELIYNAHFWDETGRICLTAELWRFAPRELSELPV
jgi:hypothetical protein